MSEKTTKISPLSKQEEMNRWLDDWHKKNGGSRLPDNDPRVLASRLPAGHVGVYQRLPRKKK